MIGAVVVIAGIIVAVVLITQGDDDSGKVADPTESATGTASKSSSASPSASSSTSPSTSPSNSPTTRRPTASAPDPRTVLANLNVDDCIDMPAAAFVTEPIHPVSCSGPDARWRIVDIFQGTDVNACGTLPPDRAAVGHLQEFTANGRVACLGFTRNTTLEDLKGLAGSAAANMTQQQFDDLRQGFVDRGYRLE
ncbi:MAG TPA: hypothetical protein VLH10_25735 [Yinghuangia sp.]|uniref:hypothetical protein n=1 Tax=Yinghuangia sp. YIM S10712 TaxID=3436930 RepID=UPI002CD5C145|nr:hypothetical protein [Yinghuangia sp.]